MSVGRNVMWGDLKGMRKVETVEQHQPWINQGPTAEDRFIQSQICADEAHQGFIDCRLLRSFGAEGEETLPGYEVISFIGLGATGGTPAPIMQQLNGAARKMLDDPDTRKRFVDLGGEPRASSPEEMRDFVGREIAKWHEVIALRKIERQ